jgi:hypothetical protein
MGAGIQVHQFRQRRCSLSRERPHYTKDAAKQYSCQALQRETCMILIATTPERYNGSFTLRSSGTKGAACKGPEISLGKASTQPIALKGIRVNLRCNILIAILFVAVNSPL